MSVVYQNRFFKRFFQWQRYYCWSRCIQLCSVCKLKICNNGVFWEFTRAKMELGLFGKPVKTLAVSQQLWTCVSAQSWPSSGNRSPLLHGCCHFLQVLEMSWLNLGLPGWVAFESWCNDSKMEGISGMHFFPAFTTWFQTWRSKGEYHWSQRSWTWQNHQFFAPVHVLALQSAFASFNKHRRSLWKHTVGALFLFHFSLFCKWEKGHGNF